MRKARGLRVSDLHMEKLTRLRRVTGKAQYALLEEAIDLIYGQFKEKAKYKETLEALEKVDEQVHKLGGGEEACAAGS